MPGFQEHEHTGLLGKVVIYLDNSTMDEYPKVNGKYATSDIKTELHKYFTLLELKVLLNKILECQQVDLFNIFRINRIYLTNYITESGYITIFEYLDVWKYKYWNGNDMTDFLCGLIGKIRMRRQSVINKVGYKLNKYPEDIVTHINNYLDNTDTISMGTRGGKRTRKHKRKHKK